MHRRSASTFSVVFALVSFLLIAAPSLLKAQAPVPPIPANHVRIHYFRPDGNYLGWTVYAFGDTTENTSNFSGGPVQGNGSNTYWAFFDVRASATQPNAVCITLNHKTQTTRPTQIMHHAP